MIYKISKNEIQMFGSFFYQKIFLPSTTLLIIAIQQVL